MIERGLAHTDFGTDAEADQWEGCCGRRWKRGEGRFRAEKRRKRYWRVSDGGEEVDGWIEGWA